MQLTNILRDVSEDYENGRLYFPSEILKSYGVDIEEVIYNFKNQTTSPTYITLWDHYADMAYKFYNDGLKQINLYDCDSQFILAGAIHLYAAIIPELRKNGYGLIKNVKVSHVKKLKILENLNLDRIL